MSDWNLFLGCVLAQFAFRVEQTPIIYDETILFFFCHKIFLHPKTALKGNSATVARISPAISSFPVEANSRLMYPKPAYCVLSCNGSAARLVISPTSFPST